MNLEDFRGELSDTATCECDNSDIIEYLENKEVSYPNYSDDLLSISSKLDTLNNTLTEASVVSGASFTAPDITEAIVNTNAKLDTLLAYVSVLVLFTIITFVRGCLRDYRKNMRV